MSKTEFSLASYALVPNSISFQVYEVSTLKSDFLGKIEKKLC